MSHCLTTDEFIRRAQQIHQNPDGTPKYRYDKVNYKTAREKVIITCPIHGDFEQVPFSHIQHKAGCPKCKGDKLNEINRMPIDEFIKRAQQIHQNPDGTPKYRYDKVKYKTIREKVIITCPIHGDFEQHAHSHLQGTACLKCSIKKRTLNADDFINICKKIHQNPDSTPKYDYSKTKYHNSKTYITITCPIHGDFVQRADMHKIGHGCPDCVNLSNIEDWIKKAQQIHQNPDGTPKYDYSKTKYNIARRKAIITCPIHGDFEQILSNHLQGRGCPECGRQKVPISNAEKEISKFISSIFNGEIKTSNRKILNNFELDIYIPSLKLGIEYNGLYWHSEIWKDKNYHLQKTKECENLGIRLIHIFENEWLEKQSIIESKIRQLLGIQKFKIPARKCIIKQVPIKDERLFLENNHLQGYIASQVCYGLYFTNPANNKEYLVSLMSFGSLRKNLGSKIEDNVFEMYRFCNIKNFNIQGGASKLFKHFLKQFKPKQVISYADRRWSVDTEHNLYRQLGFEFQGYTEPNYSYYNGTTKLINRFSMRKDILISEYNCPQNMTEQEFCEEVLGLKRIYDCGNIKYVYNYKQSIINK